MSRPHLSLTLAVLMAGNLALPISAHADTSSPPAPLSSRPLLPPVWTEPPEAVRSAAAALRDACSAWPMQLQAVPNRDVTLPPRGEPADAGACRSVLYPDDDRTEWLLIGGALGAAGAGVAIAAYYVMVALFRLLGLGVGHAWRATRIRWSRRRHGWQG